jgi:hypothetical protein
MTCFLTTKRLAKLALLSEFSLIGTLLFLNWQFTSLLIKTAMHIHCDGTYKLIWQGHTLIVEGTTDKAKQWHQLGVCISKNEKSKDYEFFFKSLKKAVFDATDKEYKPTCLVSDVFFCILNYLILVIFFKLSNLSILLVSN